VVCSDSRIGTEVSITAIGIIGHIAPGTGSAAAVGLASAGIAIPVAITIAIISRIGRTAVVDSICSVIVIQAFRIGVIISCLIARTVTERGSSQLIGGMRRTTAVVEGIYDVSIIRIAP
jgi:hypothetical protein